MDKSWSPQAMDNAAGPLVRSRGTALRSVRRIALLGNFLPRRCGIATYTFDLHAAFAARYPDIAVDVWAMDDKPGAYDYPADVTGTIAQDDPVAYSVAAQAIEASGADLLWLQHEYGIFGGPAGDMILHLADQLTIPVAVHVHTVLEEPDAIQRLVMERLVKRAQLLIVMAEEGKRRLIAHYGADPARICVIPHGIPDRPFENGASHKARFGFGQRPVVMTFGLLSPGKGIETMIDAMAAVVRHVPDALYVVLGATHPHLIAREGEAYRERLIAQAGRLGISANVRFIDGFIETEELLDYLEAADIYATPYLNPAQITSGTLSYAVGLGKAVVSTPYAHARELLADDHGRLVNFGDSAGFAREIVALLTDRPSLEALRRRTYALGRTMIWPRLAEASLDAFVAMPAWRPPLARAAAPSVALPGTAAIARMTDSTGMLQHSTFGVPDRAHGYCIDDNARALMLMMRHRGIGSEDRTRWATTYAAFIESAWNPELGLFRNFMSYDRRWLEPRGSCDSVGRTIWALGVAAARAEDEGLRLWARSRFDRVLHDLDKIEGLRARAFVMLGSIAILEAKGADHGRAREVIARYGNKLAALLAAHRRPDWAWFEIVLAYDNARLPEALIRGGRAIGRDDLVQTGLDTLEWIAAKQTARRGFFRPVGHESFGREYADPLPFDQQPVEAWATIDACAAAFELTGDAVWRDRAIAAWRWFFGENDLGIALADAATGECFDGLTPRGPNLNRGAESILAFQLAAVTIAEMGIDGMDVQVLRLAAA